MCSSSVEDENTAAKASKSGWVSVRSSPVEDEETAEACAVAEGSAVSRSLDDAYKASPPTHSSSRSLDDAADTVAAPAHFSRSLDDGLTTG